MFPVLANTAYRSRSHRCSGAPFSPRFASRRWPSATPSRISVTRRRPLGPPMAPPWTSPGSSTSMTATVARECHREYARAGARCLPPRPPLHRLFHLFYIGRLENMQPSKKRLLIFMPAYNVPNTM